MDANDTENQAEFKSALVVLVPEAESLVGRFRSRYDPSAALGMPAHITINYPFLPGKKLDSGVIHTLERVFSAHLSFRFCLASAKRFPDTLYLEPMPARPFLALIQAVPRQFPDSLPYGGIYKEIVPHLTVAQVADAKLLEEISRQLDLACKGKLPIEAAAGDICLMDNQQGRWDLRHSFALAGIS